MLANITTGINFHEGLVRGQDKQRNLSGQDIYLSLSWLMKTLVVEDIKPNISINSKLQSFSSSLNLTAYFSKVGPIMSREVGGTRRTVR